MTGTDSPEFPVSRFLALLWQETNGDLARQISMYDIGARLGLDRQTSSRIAESLMTDGMIEVRTLSGAIGFTPEGAANAMPDSGHGSGSPVRLGQNPVLQAPEREAIEKICAEFRHRFTELGLSFGQSEDFIADLKTMDAQLGSSHPKTAVFRECLSNMEKLLGSAGADDIRKRLAAFLN